MQLRYNYWEGPKIFHPTSSRPHSGASSLLFNRYQELFPQTYNCRSVNPTTQLRQVSRLNGVKLYLHFSIHHGVLWDNLLCDICTLRYSYIESFNSLHKLNSKGRLVCRDRLRRTTYGTDESRMLL